MSKDTPVIFADTFNRSECVPENTVPIDIFFQKEVRPNIIRRKRCKECQLWCLCTIATMCPIPDDLGEIGGVDSLFFTQK
jgi:hypothetical protein